MYSRPFPKNFPLQLLHIYSMKKVFGWHNHNMRVASKQQALAYFLFKSAMEKATNKMFSEIDKMKDSVDHEDIQQSVNYIQNCLHLQNSTMRCLGKALDDVLDTSMSLASNLLLNRRDNFLKLCHRDVTDKDIARLRNASLTKKELFNSKVISEVEQNFIQWSQIHQEPAFKKHRGDSYGSRSFADSKKDQSQNRGQEEVTTWR